MEAAEAGDAFSSVSGSVVPKDKGDKDEVRVRRKALQAVLEQCQRAIELLSHDDDLENESDGNHRNGASQEDENSRGSSSPDSDIDELCDMINHQVRGADFLKKIEDAQASIHIAPSEDGTPWEIVGKKDTWELENDGLEHEEYVLVKQEDIVDGIACFMSAYLLSLKQTKDLSPSQLQEALRKTFSTSKRKGKLRKAWDGSQVIYNVASWSATAVGVYQNPALLAAASTAFWTSCQAISKFF